MMKRVLVFDDEPLILKSIEKALTRVGFDVTTVRDRNGFEEKLRDNIFSLLIFDLHIPGITKEEIMELASVANPGIRFLIISGSDETEEIPFIRKPFQINELRDRVKEILNA